MRNQYEKQEKVLWYAQIMIFLGALATWFNHMDMHTFYTINIILSVISIISLILKIDLIMQEGTKMIWALTPALSLLWKTKFIAFREWDQR